ncbi:membrane protein insertase YidC [Paenibacillus sp. GCM10023252]|uniref:membrane protein insertase YidC n=1 Tax=Paenibacillus sp. GCM10023252 TaxID=3252649 RepID=UPI00361CB567
MGKNIGFTFGTIGTRNKLAIVMVMLVLLSGCGVNGTIDADTPGFFNHYVVFPLSYLIQHMAGWFGGSYGLAIIAITLVIRLALLPLMLNQSSKQSVMKDKMAVIQPEMNRIKEKYKGQTDSASKLQMQQEMQKLYSDHQFNPLAIGCLPMLIQLPILTGLYYAIKATPELAEHSFLWFQLGQPDHILPFLAGLVYLIQFKVSMIGTDGAAQKQMAILGYLSPIMMAIFSFSAPAAVPLYWVVGGTFMILQTYLSKRMYPPAAGLPALQVDAGTTAVLAGTDGSVSASASAKGTVSPSEATNPGQAGKPKSNKSSKANKSNKSSKVSATPRAAGKTTGGKP